jgi:hypothetical protein
MDQQVEKWWQDNFIELDRLHRLFEKETESEVEPERFVHKMWNSGWLGRLAVIQEREVSRLMDECVGIKSDR